MSAVRALVVAGNLLDPFPLEPRIISRLPVVLMPVPVVLLRGMYGP